VVFLIGIEDLASDRRAGVVPVAGEGRADRLQAVTDFLIRSGERDAELAAEEQEHIRVIHRDVRAIAAARRAPSMVTLVNSGERPRTEIASTGAPPYSPTKPGRR
jgi:hypothetical protein